MLGIFLIAIFTSVLKFIASIRNQAANFASASFSNFLAYALDRITSFVSNGLTLFFVHVIFHIVVVWTLAHKISFQEISIQKHILTIQESFQISRAWLQTRQMSPFFGGVEYI
jgi:hypothetical protein